MFRVLDGLIDDGNALALRAVNLVAVMVVIAVWAKTRKPGPTIVAVLVSALVVWSVNNLELIADLIDEEIEAEEPAP